MGDYSRISTRALRGMLKRALATLGHKKEVAGRHAVGTSYHTRASREAEMYERKAADMARELERRN